MLDSDEIPDAATRRPMTRSVLRGFNAARFAQLRQDRGLSVADLARLANTSLGTIPNWESGRSSPQIDLLLRVMNVLDAPIEHVVIVDPDQRYPGDWRVVRGLTQPQLAATVGIATSTLSGIERGEIALTDAAAKVLAKALQLTPAQYRDAYVRARSRPPGTSP